MLIMGARRPIWAAALAVAAMGTAAHSLPPLPCFAEEPSVDPRLKALVERHLRNDPNYKAGDLLSRGNVEPIFDDLIRLGIQPVDNNEELYDSFLTDGNYLVQLLRTPQGRTFMREAAKLPNAYDRLERLSWLSGGRTWLQQFVAAEDGPKLFAQLLTEEGMKAVEEQLGNDPRGRNFRLPTGHIHTEQQLLAKLQRAVRQQEQRDAETRKGGAAAKVAPPINAASSGRAQ